MNFTDPVDKPWVDAEAAFLHWGIPALFAIAVVVLGKWLAARKAAQRAAEEALAPAAPAAPAGVDSLRRVLLAVDGSEGSARATQRLLAVRSALRDPAAMVVHLINVQRPLSGDVTHFVPGENVERYHQERSDEAMAAARATLDAAGQPHQDHSRVGDPGPAIAEAARAFGCDLIVMGARGLGLHTAALLGSVAQSTIEHAPVPVLVVK